MADGPAGICPMMYRRQADVATAIYARLQRGRHDAEPLRLRGNPNNMLTYPLTLIRFDPPCAKKIDPSHDLS